LDWSISEW